MGEHRKVRRKKQPLTRRERDNRKARAAHSNQKISLLSSPGTGQLSVQTEDTCPKLRTEEKALSQKRRAEGTGSQLVELLPDLIKNKFVSPTTFWRVEMCHQSSVIRDIKLGQKRVA